MAKVSISQAWDETRAILARDGKLISTVALALLVLPGVIVNVLLPRGATLAPLQQGFWIVAGIAALLLTFTGQLSILRLAIVPKVAVGEAIRHAAARVLPFFGGFLSWMLPLLIGGSLPYAMIRDNPSSPQTVAGLVLILLMVVGMIVAIRLMLIGPVAAAESGGPWTILRRSWQLTEGNWWRLFGFLLMFAIGAIALLYAVSVTLNLLARLAVGTVTPLSVAGLILILVVQLITAAIYVVLFVMQARIYVQLAGDSERMAETFR